MDAMPPVYPLSSFTKRFTPPTQKAFGVIRNEYELNDRLAPGMYHQESKEEFQRRLIDPYGCTFGTGPRRQCPPGRVPVGVPETQGEDWAHLAPGMYGAGPEAIQLPDGGRISSSKRFRGISEKEPGVMKTEWTLNPNVPPLINRETWGVPGTGIKISDSHSGKETPFRATTKKDGIYLVPREQRKETQSEDWAHLDPTNNCASLRATREKESWNRPQIFRMKNYGPRWAHEIKIPSVEEMKARRLKIRADYAKKYGDSPFKKEEERKKQEAAEADNTFSPFGGAECFAQRADDRKQRINKLIGQGRGQGKDKRPSTSLGVALAEMGKEQPSRRATSHITHSHLFGGLSGGAGW